MEITVLGCYGAEARGFKTTCFKINESLLLDAGALTSSLSITDQSKIKNILITHAHLDHIKDIPLFTDNVIGLIDQPVNIISAPEVIATLKEHIFNNQVWPDFTVIPSPENPVIRYQPIETGKAFFIDDLKITAVEVNHTAPTVAYIIEDKKHGAVAFSGDTGETDEFWHIINDTDNMKAIFVETSFPSDMETLAKLSKHLTPDLLKQELTKLDDARTPVYLYHMKPNFLDTLTEEVSQLGIENLSMLNLNQTIQI